MKWVIQACIQKARLFFLRCNFEVWYTSKIYKIWSSTLLWGFKFFFLSVQWWGSISAVFQSNELDVQCMVIARKEAAKFPFNTPHKFMSGKYIRQCFACGEWRASQVVVRCIPNCLKENLKLWSLNNSSPSRSFHFQNIMIEVLCYIGCWTLGKSYGELLGDILGNTLRTWCENIGNLMWTHIIDNLVDLVERHWEDQNLENLQNSPPLSRSKIPGLHGCMLHHLIGRENFIFLPTCITHFCLDWMPLSLISLGWTTSYRT